MNKTELDRVIQAEYGSLSGIVVLEHSAPIYENYFNGYGPGDVIHVASVTKSYLSALVGIAIEKGFLQSVEQRVLDFFPEYHGGSGRETTLAHLLSMTAVWSYEEEPFWEVCENPGWAENALGLLADGAPGPFRYSTVGANLLSAVLARATGKSAREFANETLFAPLGMGELPDMPVSNLDFTSQTAPPGWVSGAGGGTIGGWGLTLTARQMARFGQMYLDHGVWEGKQVVPAAWVRESTARRTEEYGWFWWLFDDCFCALGDGGNGVCCFPEREIVVAMNAQYTPEPGDGLKLIREYILK